MFCKKLCLSFRDFEVDEMLQYKTLSGDKQGSISSKVGMIESIFKIIYFFFESQSEIYVSETNEFVARK